MASNDCYHFPKFPKCYPKNFGNDKKRKFRKSQIAITSHHWRRPRRGGANGGNAPPPPTGATASHEIDANPMFSRNWGVGIPICRTAGGGMHPPSSPWIRHCVYLSRIFSGHSLKRKTWAKGTCPRWLQHWLKGEKLEDSERKGRGRNGRDPLRSLWS